MKETNEQALNIKNNKGITLISIMITIVIMLIVASVTVNISADRFQINSNKKMINDIELLHEKVESYYLKYGILPIKKDSNNNPIEKTNLNLIRCIWKMLCFRFRRNGKLSIKLW